MRQFLKKIFLYLILPFTVIALFDAFLPITFFTNRHFEAVSFMTSVPHRGINYQNINSSMDAVGDMCFHTKYAIIKKEVWKTDKLGFRSEKLIEDPDILFVGDSFIEGTSLTQNATIPYVTNAKLNNEKRIYSIAPTNSISEFDKYLQKGIIKKPKLLVYSIVERNVPEPLTPFDANKGSLLDDAIISIFETKNINVYLDKAIRQYSIEWLKGKIVNSKGPGVPAIDQSNMFFLNGVNQKHFTNDIKKTVDVLVSYKSYCDSLGIDFLFVPMPDKETVYFEKVPFQKQPTYLVELDSILTLKGVPTINTLKIYNEYRVTNTNLLYHLDDTHWNSNATELIAEKIANYALLRIK